MSTNLSLRNKANTKFLNLSNRLIKIIHLKADVMNTTIRVLLQEIGNGGFISEFVEEFKLGVGHVDEEGCDAVLREVEEVLGEVGVAEAEAGVSLGSLFEGDGFGDGDGEVVEAAELGSRVEGRAGETEHFFFVFFESR